jgi:UDP-glucose 4-epimerase
LEGRAPTIFGDGSQSRDFTYVDNVVQANLLAAGADAKSVAGRTFNIATGVRFTLNEVYDLLKMITGFRGDAAYDRERIGDVKHSLADISAAWDAFGYRPVVGFKEGLRRTVAWYREQLAVPDASTLTRTTR